ncbi:MAG: Smr/MutS family protein [Candidatus Falkowbacteria bacterium]|nr:Smr/MutS family protein [Candidatus Falkowbacteria bacterium]
MPHKKKKLKVNIKYNKYAQIIDDQLDLHGYTQKEAEASIYNFLNHARANSFKKIRIITGKGLHSEGGQGVLRELLIDMLRAQELSFTDAKINDGGSGAVEISLIRR